MHGEPQGHGKNLIGTIRVELFTMSFILLVYDVLETQLEPECIAFHAFIQCGAKLGHKNLQSLGVSFLTYLFCEEYHLFDLLLSGAISRGLHSERLYDSESSSQDSMA